MLLAGWHCLQLIPNELHNNKTELIIKWTASIKEEEPVGKKRAQREHEPVLCHAFMSM